MSSTRPVMHETPKRWNGDRSEVCIVTWLSISSLYSSGLQGRWLQLTSMCESREKWSIRDRSRVLDGKAYRRRGGTAY